MGNGSGLICLVFGLGVPLALGLWVVLNYNGLVRTRNTLRESWAVIDTELRRRYDLVPNLVETVRGYAQHEREVLQRVTEARARAVASQGSPREQAADENILVDALRHIFALSEGYPQLRANENFLALQKELVNTEDRIQASRRFYNANVREFNNRCQMFPSSLVASIFGFQPAEYFEVEETGIRSPVDVDLGPQA